MLGRLILLWALTPLLYSGDKIPLVKQGFLSAGEDIRIGLILKHYKWFDKTEWTQTSQGNAEQVTFTGFINDAEAIKAFDEQNKYRFSFAFKAMQLEPVYGLTKDKQQLCYQLYFKFSDARNFDLVGGALGVMENDKWRYVPFSEKALEMVLAGIYSNEPPYNSLVKGLPYR